MDNISVIVRTKNEERWIGHTIQSLLEFIKQPEIIVVDDHSIDDTINIVKNFKEDPELKKRKRKSYTSVKIIDIDKYTPGKAINLGVSHCTNKYILIISSHCVLKKINSDKLKNDLKKHVCIFGDQTPIWQGKKITKRYLWSHYVDNEVVNMFSEQEDRYYMHNALAFYKKEILEKHPFDENLMGKEDRYWANDMIKRGYSILYDPLISVDHHYTANGNTWKGIG